MGDAVNLDAIVVLLIGC